MAYTVTLPDGSTRSTNSQTVANAMAANSGGTVISSPTSSSSSGGQTAASQQHSQDAYNNAYETFVQQNPQFANAGALNQHVAGGGSSVMPAHDGGWAYTDKYGFSHVVEDRATAEQYSDQSSLTPYYGSFSGGYATNSDGQRMMVNTPGAIPYGNDGNMGTMQANNYGAPMGGYVGGEFYDQNAYQEALKRFQATQQNQLDTAQKTQANSVVGSVAEPSTPAVGSTGYQRPMDNYTQPKKYSASITDAGHTNAQSRYLKNNYGGR